jgi:hypothetical protein
MLNKEKILCGYIHKRQIGSKDTIYIGAPDKKGFKMKKVKITKTESRWVKNFKLGRQKAIGSTNLSKSTMLHLRNHLMKPADAIALIVYPEELLDIYRLIGSVIEELAKEEG